MDGLQVGDTTPLRPRKRPSTHMLLEDEEQGAAAGNFGNPGPDSVAAAGRTSPSGTMGVRTDGSRNEEERMNGHSFHRAHSCLALVGGRRCSCSGKAREEQERQHQLEDENDNDGEERCCGHRHAIEKDGSTAAASRSAEPRRRIKRIKSEPSIVVLTEAVTSSASKKDEDKGDDDDDDDDEDNAADDVSNTSSSHRDTDDSGGRGDSSRSSSSSSNDLEAMKQLGLSTHDKNVDDSSRSDDGHYERSRQDTRTPDAAAIVSVDGSNESSSNNADRHQRAKKPSHLAAQVVDKDDGLATNPHVLAGAEVDSDGVPITPAYGVPPRPESCPVDMDPDTFIRATVRAYLGYEPQIRDGLSLPSPDFFPPITEDDLAAYDTDIVAAVRENHLDQIRSFHNSGRTLSSCNRFGESLIHMACRRGYADTVTYLLEEAHVSVRIRDDCGRTPLHDACWHRTTQYEIVDTIIRVDPALLCISDKRGHTPFAYARREHWPLWRQFLFDRTDWIVAGFAHKEIMTRFGGGTADDKFEASPKAQ
mmetsp:Transcript_7940/g.22132  ORF Transcript_7940/g.22132 Transcript_7940/m.22132 type:complete len:534 (+) Transcript_7940:104-1705(+)